MAVGTRGTNTQDEMLRKLLGSITEIKMAPDADLEFLVNLETTVLQYIRGRAEAAMQPSPSPPMDQISQQFSGMGMATPGMAQPPTGGMPGMPGAGGGGGVPGIRQEPAMPNPDELRRMLGQ